MILKVVAVTFIILCNDWHCIGKVGGAVNIIQNDTKEGPGGPATYTTDCFTNGRQLFATTGSFTYLQALDNIARDGATLFTIVDDSVVMEGVDSLLRTAKRQGVDGEFWTDTTTAAPEAHYAIYMEQDERLERTLFSDDTELDGFIAYRNCENF